MSPESLERAREWMRMDMLEDTADIMDNVGMSERRKRHVERLAALLDTVRAEERERCAKIAECTRAPILTGHDDDSPMASQAKGFYIGTRTVAAGIRDGKP